MLDRAEQLHGARHQGKGAVKIGRIRQLRPHPADIVSLLERLRPHAEYRFGAAVEIGEHAVAIEIKLPPHGQRLGMSLIGMGRSIGIQPSRAITSLLSFARRRSEEHTSELQSLMRISYAVFCLKKQKRQITEQDIN